MSNYEKWEYWKGKAELEMAKVERLTSEVDDLRALLREAIEWNWCDDDIEDGIDSKILAKIRAAVQTGQTQNG